jgi:hypothetical protein
VSRISLRVQSVCPPNKHVAVIDKHDPTLLHLSRRRGRHFPELPGLPLGAYPPTSREAIEHLEALRREGVHYLVVPSYSSWWLQFYEGFAAHLDSHYRRVCNDEEAVIFDLAGAGVTAHRQEGMTNAKA